MFNYFGSKYWLARRYPEPQHDLIIEPFAGSAQYSLCHWQRRVILVEKDPRIYAIWQYLQKSTSRQILALPVPAPSEEIRHRIPEARDLIALCMNRGTSKPQRVAGSWPQLPALWQRKKEIIAGGLHKIKHWKIYNRDYTRVRNQKATWFVDPPYVGLNGYVAKVDCYDELADWCRERRGQIIVCEMGGADWLPFVAFAKSKTLKGHRSEVIWVRPD